MEGRNAVLLTNDGAFKSVKLKRTAEVAVGQTILSEHLSQPYWLKKYFVMPILAACLSFSFVMPLSNSSYENKADAAAYVSFDVTPSIEATINQHYDILSVQTMNKEAESIIPHPETLQNIPLSRFISIMMVKLKEKGYLRSNSLFLVATAVTGRVQRGDRRSFQNGLGDILHGKPTHLLQTSGANLEWIQTSLKRHTDAQKRKLSIGKYTLYLEANQHEKRLTLDEARHSSAIKIKQAIESKPVPTQILDRNAPELEWPGQLIKLKKSGHLGDSVFKSQLRHFRDTRRQQDRYDQTLKSQPVHGRRQIEGSQSILPFAGTGRQIPADGAYSGLKGKNAFIRGDTMLKQAC